MPTETIRSNVPVEVAIVEQLELDPVGNAGRRGPLARDLELLLGQGDAEHVDVGDAVEIEREPAPAAADVEHPLARLEVQLGGDMGLLVELGLLEAVARIGEIAAAILQVGVEEEPVEVVAEVVMVGDVALRPARCQLRWASGRAEPAALPQELAGAAAVLPAAVAGGSIRPGRGYRPARPPADRP